MRFKIIIRNKILGDSEQVMDSLDHIKHYNVVAYSLARKAAEKPGEFFAEGMWTVIAID